MAFPPRSVTPGLFIWDNDSCGLLIPESSELFGKAVPPGLLGQLPVGGFVQII